MENAQELTSSIGQERRLSSGAAFAHGARAMSRPTPQAGFTLIEVLVALAIIAVAMSAAVRVAAVMTQSNGLLRDKSIALLAARSQLAQLRLEGRFVQGSKVSECDTGR